MKATLSLFPKYYQHFEMTRLADVVREIGLDRVNAVIRDGYWVTRESIKESLPEFVKTMQQGGVNVHFATAGFSAEEVVSDPEPLAVMADCGITEFRMGYFGVQDNDVRGSLARARESLEKMVPVCEKYGVRAIYQLHHHTLISSPFAAWQIVNGLPSRWLGVEIDPGNQSFEGWEDWNKTMGLLGEYVVASGIKDSTVSRDPSQAHEPTKGWRRYWTPIYEGTVNWRDFVQALRAADFEGTLVFMPFYEVSDDTDMTQKLMKEVAYLKQVLADVQSE